MSQISRSQNINFALNEFLDSVDKNCSIFQTYDYDLSEDYFDCLSEDFGDNCELSLEQSVQFIEQFYKICSQILSKCSFDQLVDSKLFEKIHSPIYYSVKCLINQSEEFKLINLISSMEIFYEYLTKTASITQIKFDLIDLFLLSTLNSFVCLCGYLKNNKQFNFSQKATISSQSGSRLDLKLSSLLIKVLALFESKITNLNELSNKPNLIKACKLLVFLVKNFKDTKSNVFVWKTISKLVIKFKILLNNNNNESVNCKFLIKKYFTFYTKINRWT